MKIKDNVKRYWAVWFLFTGALIITRFTVLARSSEGERFFIFCFYISITWIPLIIISVHQGSQIESYLEENHPEVYKEVYNWKGYVPTYSSVRMRRFIKSSENHGDLKITELKSRARSLSRLFITVFIAIPFLFVIVML